MSGERVEWPRPRPDPDQEPAEPWARKDGAWSPDWAKIRKELARADPPADPEP